jgi:hypothetical protein
MARVAHKRACIRGETPEGGKAPGRQRGSSGWPKRETDLETGKPAALPRGTREGGRGRRGHAHRRRLTQGGRRANTTPPAGIPATASHGSRPTRSFGSTPSQAPRSRQSPHRARHPVGWVRQGPAFLMRTAIKGQSLCSMRQRNQALTAAERASPGSASVRLSPKARAARRASATSPIATYSSVCKPFDPRIHLQSILRLLSYAKGSRFGATPLPHPPLWPQPPIP